MSRVEVPHALQDRVAAKLRTGCDILNKHFSVAYPVPRVDYNVDSMAAGYATESEWLIEFNGRLLIENADQFIDEIPYHELAHLYADRVLIAAQPAQLHRRVHCGDWRRAMSALGADPHIYHSFDVSRYRRQPHVYTCESCWTTHNMSHYKHKRLQENKLAYKCTICDGDSKILLYDSKKQG